MKIYGKYSIIIIFISLLVNLINNSENKNSTDINDIASIETQNSVSIEEKESNKEVQKENDTIETTPSNEIKNPILVGDESQELLNDEKDNQNTNDNINDINDLKNRCLETEPSENIIEDCSIGNNMTEKGNKCCYIEFKYDYNKYYGCIPLDLTKVNIKDEIKNMKNEYNANSIKIKCKSSFIHLKLFK